MRERINELRDAIVVVITFDPQTPMAEHQRDRLAPLTVRIDESRSTYLAYGLNRGSVWDVWGPKIWRSYARLLLRGRRLQRPRADTLQLGGDFVIDRAGRIAYIFRSADPDDRPTVDAIITAVQST